jgi:hypothetical protein
MVPLTLLGRMTGWEPFGVLYTFWVGSKRST